MCFDLTDEQDEETVTTGIKVMTEFGLVQGTHSDVRSCGVSTRNAEVEMSLRNSLLGGPLQFFVSLTYPKIICVS